MQEIKEESLLDKYARERNIEELSSEDIIKLMMEPYLIREICEAFHITEKKFNELRKRHGITNTVLEDIIRNIEVILDYIDSKPRYVSSTIQKKVVSKLIPCFTTGIPKREFYIKELSKIDFSRKKVKTDIEEKQIDKTYRLNELSDILLDIDKIVDKMLKQEKDFLLEKNHNKLYNQMIEEKKQGKKFQKEDLSYEVMFELAVVENLADALIAELFDMTKEQIKYIRRKIGISHKYHKKIETYPEIIMYYIEKDNKRMPGVSNYQYEEMINQYIIQEIKKENLETSTEEPQKVSIYVDGNPIQYCVTFSEEKYSASTKKGKVSKGAKHNHAKENETKKTHGQIGEQLVFEMERLRLQKLGLESLAKEVKLVAQIGEDTTFDGLGYDLISFNAYQERICIEAKTSFGKKDRPFFISKKELEVMQGIKKEYDCKECLIYYVLVDGENVTIKKIDASSFPNLKLTPILYKVESEI